MRGDDRFWFLFGGIFLLVGVCFVAASLGINLFADPETLNKDTPLWLFFAAGLVLSAGGGGIIYWAWTAAARDRRLMRSGVELVASVTDLRRALVDINREARWHVCFRYEYPPGQKRDGESRPLASFAAREFKLGDRVKIKVDPQQPDESLFLGAA